MAYAIEKGEAVGVGLARAIREQIEAVVDNLRSSANGTAADQIHCSRVGLKRIRAALSLAKTDAPEVRRRLDRVFRDAGRGLSASRDAEVLVETFDKLTEKFDRELAAEPIAPVRKVLVSARKAARSNQPAAGAVAARLSARRRTVRELRSIEDIGPDMQNAYRRGRRGLRDAYKQRSNEAFHEWRKAVKRHSYQIELLESSLPEKWSGYREKLKDLARILGDDHNLAVLDQTLPRESAKFRELIERWQKELRAQAAALGESIFRDKPHKFRKRFDESWRTAMIEG